MEEEKLTKPEDYLVELSRLKEQQEIGTLMGKALKSSIITPAVYEAMCRTALDKGFKFHNIQLNQQLMEQQKLKVGQRIELVEILTDTIKDERYLALSDQ